MYKTFHIQKAAMWAFSILAVAAFAYALYFMTDYKDLFGLKLQLNAQIAEFHDETLQTFNQQIFVAAIVGVLVILVSRMLEVQDKVPDLFAVVVICVLLGWILYENVTFYVRIDEIREIYTNLDFQYYYLEGTADYELSLSTFSLGQGLYLVFSAVCGVYGLSLLGSHVAYRVGRRHRSE